MVKHRLKLTTAGEGRVQNAVGIGSDNNESRNAGVVVVVLTGRHDLAVLLKG